eukprot:4964162-Amphidinium_carterae.2
MCSPQTGCCANALCALYVCTASTSGTSKERLESFAHPMLSVARRDQTCHKDSRSVGMHGMNRTSDLGPTYRALQSLGVILTRVAHQFYMRLNLKWVSFLRCPWDLEAMKTCAAMIAARNQSFCCYDICCVSMGRSLKQKAWAGASGVQAYESWGLDRALYNLLSCMPHELRMSTDAEKDSKAT